MVMTYKATEERVSRGRAAGWMFLSLAILMIIVSEPSHSRFNTHSDCCWESSARRHLALDILILEQLGLLQD